MRKIQYRFLSYISQNMENLEAVTGLIMCGFEETSPHYRIVVNKLLHEFGIPATLDIIKDVCFDWELARFGNSPGIHKRN